MNKPLRPETIWKLVDNWDTSEVLDCGSGDGHQGMQYYIDQGLETGMVTAIDIDANALKVLHEKGIRTECVDLEKIDLAPHLLSKYDIILCCEVFEHLTWETEKDLLDSFIRMLDRNGSLVLSFPIDVKMDGKFPGKPHIRQPNVIDIEKTLLEYFQNYTKVEMNYRTQLLLFSGRK